MRTIRHQHDIFHDPEIETLPVKKQVFIFMLFIFMAGAALMLFFILQGS